MENNTFNIVSYVSNERGFEKTSFIYDTINNRVIEKWISYQLTNDKSKFVITNRYIYVYNTFNIIYRILEVEKGEDDRMYSFLNNDNEYCHSFNRTVNKLELNDRTITEVIYTRNNFIGSKRKKRFIRSLNLLTKEIGYNISKTYKTRINYLLKNGRLYIYEYKQNDFCFLNKIVEYEILIDFRFVNRLINLIGLPLLMTIPDLFLKKKINEVFVHDNEEKIPYKQDYFRDYDNNCKNYSVHNSILIEDLFINEKSEIDKKYDTLK